MRALVLTLLLCLAATGAQAKVFQYHLASGRVTSDFKVAIDDTVPGYGVATVDDAFEWPIPAPGVGYTTCLTGASHLSQYVGGEVTVRPIPANQALFHCFLVNKSKAVFQIMKLVAPDLAPNDENDLLPLIIRIAEKCPATNVSQRCDQARNLNQTISNNPVDALIAEGLALILLKGW